MEYEQEIEEHNQNEEKKEKGFEVEKEYSSYGQKGMYTHSLSIRNTLIRNDPSNSSIIRNETMEWIMKMFPTFKKDAKRLMI